MATAYAGGDNRLTNSLPLHGHRSSFSTFNSHNCIGKYTFTRDGQCVMNVQTRRLVTEARLNALLGTDLRADYESAVLVQHHEILNLLKQRSFLHWIIENRFFPGVEEGKYKKPDFICFSGYIACSLKTPLSTIFPYNDNFNWSLYAARDHDVIYLCGTQKRAKKVNEKYPLREELHEGFLSKEVLHSDTTKEGRKVENSLSKMFHKENLSKDVLDDDSISKGCEKILSKKVIDSNPPKEVDIHHETDSSKEVYEADESLSKERCVGTLSNEVFEYSVSKEVLEDNLPRRVNVIDEISPSLIQEGGISTVALHPPKEADMNHENDSSKEVYKAHDSLSKKFNVETLDCSLPKEVRENNHLRRVCVIDEVRPSLVHEDNVSTVVPSPPKEVAMTHATDPSKEVSDADVSLSRDVPEDNLKRRVYVSNETGPSLVNEVIVSPVVSNPQKEVDMSHKTDPLKEVYEADDCFSKESYIGTISNEVLEVLGENLPKRIYAVDETSPSFVQENSVSALVPNPPKEYKTNYEINPSKEVHEADDCLSKEILDCSVSKDLYEADDCLSKEILDCSVSKEVLEEHLLRRVYAIDELSPSLVQEDSVSTMGPNPPKEVDMNHETEPSEEVHEADDCLSKESYVGILSKEILDCSVSIEVLEDNLPMKVYVIDEISPSLVQAECVSPMVPNAPKEVDMNHETEPSEVVYEDDDRLSKKSYIGTPLKEVLDCSFLKEVLENNVPRRVYEIDEISPSLVQEGPVSTVIPNPPKEVDMNHEIDLLKEVYEADDGLSKEIYIGTLSKEILDCSVSKEDLVDNLPIRVQVIDEVSPSLVQKDSVSAAVPNPTKEVDMNHKNDPSKHVYEGDDRLSKESYIGTLSKEVLDCSLLKKVLEDNVPRRVYEIDEISPSLIQEYPVSTVIPKPSKEVDMNLEADPTKEVYEADDSLSKESFVGRLSKEVLDCSLSKEVLEDILPKRVYVIDETSPSFVQEDSVSTMVPNPPKEHNMNYVTDPSKEVYEADDCLSKESFVGTLSKEILDCSVSIEVLEDNLPLKVYVIDEINPSLVQEECVSPLVPNSPKEVDMNHETEPSEVVYEDDDRLSKKSYIGTPLKEVLDCSFLKEVLENNVPRRVYEIDEISPSLVQEGPVSTVIPNPPKEVDMNHEIDLLKEVYEADDSLSKESYIGTLSKEILDCGVSKEDLEDNLPRRVQVIDEISPSLLQKDSVSTAVPNPTKEADMNRKFVPSKEVYEADDCVSKSYVGTLSKKILGCTVSKEVFEDNVSRRIYVIDEISPPFGQVDSVSTVVPNDNCPKQVQKTSSPLKEVQGVDEISISNGVNKSKLSKEVFVANLAEEVQKSQEASLSLPVQECIRPRQFHEDEHSEGFKKDFWKYSGLYFQHLLTHENPQETILDEYRKDQWVNEIGFGKHQLLCLSGMNAEDEDGKGIDMVLSTSHSRLKQIEYWARNIVPGRKTLISGCRDESMLLSRLKKTLVTDIPRKFLWNPRLCYEFEERLLNWMKCHFKENNPRIVKKFSWSCNNPSHVRVCDVPEDEIPDLLLPEWYLEQVQSQMPGRW